MFFLRVEMGRFGALLKPRQAQGVEKSQSALRVYFVEKSKIQKNMIFDYVFVSRFVFRPAALAGKQKSFCQEGLPRVLNVDGESGPARIQTLFVIRRDQISHPPYSFPLPPGSPHSHSCWESLHKVAEAPKQIKKQIITA